LISFITPDTIKLELQHFFRWHVPDSSGASVYLHFPWQHSLPRDCIVLLSFREIFGVFVVINKFPVILKLILTLKTQIPSPFLVCHMSSDISV